MGGIRRPEAGYKEFTIEPWITKDGPKQVRSHYNSLYGKIVSNWMVEADVLTMEVTIPANTTAILKLSGIRPGTLKEGEKAWKEVEGISLHLQKGNALSLALQSGTYRFTVRMDEVR